MSSRRIFIDDARKQGRPLPHTMLLATAGAGKTSLASIIAAEVDDPMTVFDLSKSKPGGLGSFIRRLNHEGGGIVFMDEFHRATRRQQEEALELLEEGFVTMPSGGKVYCDWLTIIAATTEPDQILGTIMDRFAVKAKFADYTDDEMTTIVSQMARTIGRDMDDDLQRILGTASAGVPRQARNLVMAWDALSSGRTDPVAAAEVLALCDVEHDGLSADHIAYLNELEKRDGPCGVKPLSEILNVHIKTVSQLEKLLYRRDYIRFTTRGRELTQKGYERLQNDTPVRRNRRREMAMGA
jgi:Holliday junction DNA helicase RuvB